LKTTVLEGQVGLQFEPRNVRALAEKIAYLIEHPEINARFRRNARPYVERHYSWPSIAEQAAVVYRRVLAEYRPEEGKEV
jgi:colanic acid/amylovoran biosynthesis glycosyltransferase